MDNLPRKVLNASSETFTSIAKAAFIIQPTLSITKEVGVANVGGIEVHLEGRKRQFTIFLLGLLPLQGDRKISA